MGAETFYFDGAAVGPAGERPRKREAVCHHVRTASLGDLLPKAWPPVHVDGSAFTYVFSVLQPRRSQHHSSGWQGGGGEKEG